LGAEDGFEDVADAGGFERGCGVVVVMMRGMTVVGHDADEAAVDTFWLKFESEIFDKYRMTICETHTLLALVAEGSVAGDSNFDADDAVLELGTSISDELLPLVVLL